MQACYLYQVHIIYGFYVFHFQSIQTELYYYYIRRYCETIKSVFRGKLITCIWYLRQSQDPHICIVSLTPSINPQSGPSEASPGHKQPPTRM